MGPKRGEVIGVGEHCILRKSIVYTYHQILFLLSLELLGNRLIEPVFFNSIPRTGLSTSFWDDLNLVFPLVSIKF
jgi:hypothetical protein